jgi:putative hydrolase of the HAD superfamily
LHPGDRTSAIPGGWWVSKPGKWEVIDPKQVEVIFLDAGGVLLYPDWERVSAILAKYGIAVPSAQLAEAEFAAKRSMDEAGFTTTTGDITEPDGYLGWVVKAADVDYDHEGLHAAAAEFESTHASDNLWSDMPEEVPGALARLRHAGYRLAVLSNTESNLRDRIKSAGIEPFFETLVISAEVGSEKPDRKIFDEALRRMAVAPEHALHVGDFYSIDVVGARGARIPAVMLDSKGLSPDRDVTRVASLTELADYLIPRT